MTVGSGIVWSTVLVLMALMAYQLTVHGKWRLVGKIVLGFIAALSVIVGGFWAWDRYENLPRAVDGLNGVRFGMSPLDVKLAKGAPDDEGKPEEEAAGSWSSVMVFGVDASNPTLVVWFRGKDRNDLKVRLICETEGYSRLFGLGRYDSEESIIAKLGQPTHTSIAKDGLSKMVSFEPFKAAFEISKGVVAEVCASESGRVTYRDEYQVDHPKESK